VDGDQTKTKTADRRGSVARHIVALAMLALLLLEAFAPRVVAAGEKDRSTPDLLIALARSV
jgi:hypothetical protein